MIKELVEKIAKANEAYRLGSPIMSDGDYDILIDELWEIDPHNPILSKIGLPVRDESRKRILPVDMASMNKVKSVSEIQNWFRLKEIPQDQELVITPKYDGLSLCVDETKSEATTRGDGEVGQDCDIHYNLLKNKLSSDEFIFTWGEVIMTKSTFMSKYSSDYANPRNLVAGLLNSKEVTSPLEDTIYIKYGGVLKNRVELKSEILEKLNSSQEFKVPFKIVKLSDLSEDFLFKTFKEWSIDFEIDGLILEVNSLSVQDELGRETSSNNPCWARAFKSPHFEQSAQSEVISISWNISKQGYLKPTLHINPVKLDGVTVSNVTGNNARFVKDMGLGKGARVIIKRSGMVIPTIVDVLETVPFEMPNVPDIKWSDSGVELQTIAETDEQRLKKLIAFFQILEADNVSEGIVTQLWESGYRTVKDILFLTKDDLSKLEGFGSRKSEIVYNSIQKSVTDVELCKLQHATGIFSGLGSKKLALLQHFTEKPTIDDILSIEGFAEISAKSYLDGWDKFWEFVKDLPVTIKKEVELSNSGELIGQQFVFTGVRRPDLEDIITSKGGKIGSGVSKNTTYLVMKSKGSGSSKEIKAQKLGVQIITVEELEEIIK